MSRLVDYIIEDVREHTENQEFSESEGLSDNEFIRFLNDAQYRIHSLIVQQHPAVFIEEKEVDIVAGQESYSLPSDIHMGNKVSMVEYSSTGDSDDYYVLKPTPMRNRMSGVDGDPAYYIRKSGKILLAPVPTGSGKLRISYVRGLPVLAQRSASVATAVLTTDSITSLACNVSTDEVDSTTLNKSHFITVVDREGEVKMHGIEIDSVDASTGIVSVTSGFTFEPGETIDVGDYIVTGKYSTTHPQLDLMVERYLISYASWKILKRDSSIDSTEAMQELASMEEEIVAAYADIDDDITEIPEINEDDWGI